jgi:hypothetical protein
MELVLKDFLFFEPKAGRKGGPSSDPDIRRASSSGKGLKVTYVASHAGLINRNFSMYSPAGVKDSCHTWVWPIPKPIQIHHDEHADPIGRVIGARYTPYGGGEGHSDSAVAAAFKLFDEASSPSDVVKATRLLEETGALAQDGWKGVGELILEGIITDSSAIEKTLDGRYLGVSITQYPEEAFCNVCGRDYKKDGPCGHRGEVDEESGRVGYLVVGKTRYTELSFVNAPADDHAMVVNAGPVELSPPVHASESKTSVSDSIRTISFQLVDSVNEVNSMSDGKVEDSVETGDETQHLAQTPDEAEAGNPNLADKAEAPVEQDELQEVLVPEVTVEEALTVLFEDSENLTEDLVEIINEALEDEVKSEEENKESDAVLTTKKRKSLPSSTFCGPGRSFPVPDCKHVTAARRLIGRYKGPGDRQRILSCVARKAKALGCKSAQKSEEETQRDSFQPLEDMTDERLQQALLDVEKLMASRGLRAERKCNDCEEKDSRLTTFEAEVPELQDTIKVLRSEWKDVSHEQIASEEAHANTISRFQSFLRSYLEVATLLTNKDAEESSVKTEIESMTLEDLEKSAGKINLSETISFVRSGFSRTPEGTVTSEDAEAEEEIVPEETVSEGVILLSQTLVNARRDYGNQFAMDCMCTWINDGKLPQGFTLDKASELVAK